MEDNNNNQQLNNQILSNKETLLMPFIANNLEGQHGKIEKKEYSSKYD